VFNGTSLQQPAISLLGLGLLTFLKERMCAYEIIVLAGCVSLGLQLSIFEPNELLPPKFGITVPEHL
jgi:hypothetical protein